MDTTRQGWQYGIGPELDLSRNTRRFIGPDIDRPSNVLDHGRGRFVTHCRMARPRRIRRATGDEDLVVIRATQTTGGVLSHTVTKWQYLVLSRGSRTMWCRRTPAIFKSEFVRHLVRSVSETTAAVTSGRIALAIPWVSSRHTPRISRQYTIRHFFDPSVPTPALIDPHLRVSISCTLESHAGPALVKMDPARVE